MSKFMKKLANDCSVIKLLTELDHRLCDVEIESLGSKVKLSANNSYSNKYIEDKESLGYTAADIVIALIQARICQSNTTQYYTLTDALSNYIQHLGTMNMKLSDYIPLGTTIVRCNIDGVISPISILRENGAVFTCCPGPNDESRLSSSGVVRDSTIYKTTIDDGVGPLDTMGYVLKFFQALAEGIPVTKTSINDGKLPITKHNKRKQAYRKNVKYISLSDIGHDRLRTIIHAQSRSSSVYVTGSWWRRPHLRRSKEGRLSYVNGSWCFRKCGDVIKAEEIEIIHTV